MNRFLLACLLFVSITCQGQNYNPLQYGVKRYFTNGNGYLRGMRVDSVTAVGADTVYHMLHTPRAMGYCFPSGVDTVRDPDGGSWLGKEVIRLADGTFLFDNLWHDTVIIKTQAGLGDQWNLYDDTTNIYYTATVTAIDTMTVSGLLDSIKTITVHADTAGMPRIGDPVDGFKLILSKDHGFVAAFDLYTFPYHLPNSRSNQPFLDYYLDVVLERAMATGYDPYGPPWYGNSPDTVNSIFRQIQFYNPMKMEIFHLGYGDVYEMTKNETHLLGDYIHSELVDSVTSAMATSSFVSYSTVEHISSHIYPSDYFTFSYTINSASGDTSLFIDTSKMPEEKGAEYFYHYFPDEGPDTALCSIRGKYVIDYTYITDMAYVGIGWNSEEGRVLPRRTQTYFIGYGLWSEYWSNPSGMITTDKYCTYFYKNGTVCYGAFRWLEDVNNVKNAWSVVSIYPNPTDGRITIKLPKQQCTIRISNVMGQQVYTAQADNQEFIIDMSSLSAGLYTVAIADNSGNSVVRKLSVVH